MKAVLISIQPKWVDKIICGKKTIEVRKTKPKLEVPFKCYIYCTKGKIELPVERKINRELEDLCDGYEILYWANGKVIGEFICDKITDISVVVRNCNEDYNQVYHNDECKGSCLTWKELQEYGNGKPLYGWHISDLKIYDKPKELSEFKKENKCYYADYEKGCCWENCPYFDFKDCDGKYSIIFIPPQSWCYVEEV